MRKVIILLLVAAFSCGGAARAEETNAAELERRVLQLAQELRCLVCQNQTIADSNAPLAVDLREQVRRQIAEGRSDEEIIDYMTARYGEFVRYRPALTASTIVLWFAPALLLLGGIAVLLRSVRAGRSAQPLELTPEEQTRAAALLRRPAEPRS